MRNRVKIPHKYSHIYLISYSNYKNKRHSTTLEIEKHYMYMFTYIYDARANNIKDVLWLRKRSHNLNDVCCNTLVIYILPSFVTHKMTSSLVFCGHMVWDIFFFEACVKYCFYLLQIIFKLRILDITFDTYQNISSNREFSNISSP